MKKPTIMVETVAFIVDKILSRKQIDDHPVPGILFIVPIRFQGLPTAQYQLTGQLQRLFD